MPFVNSFWEKKCYITIGERLENCGTKSREYYHPRATLHRT